MAGAGFGRGVALIAGGEYGALRQPLEPAGEMRAILGEEIRGELIDRDCDDQLRLWRGCGCCWRGA